MDKIQQIPMMIVHDLVIMPGTNVHFDIQKEISIKAVNIALEQNELLFVAMAKDKTDSDKVDIAELFLTGTLVKVKQVLKLPKGLIRVMFCGMQRAHLDSIDDSKECLYANFKPVDNADDMTDVEKDAALRSIKDVLKQCEQRNMIQNPTMVETFSNMMDLEALIDTIAEAMPMPIAQKRRILEINQLSERVERILIILLNEISVLDIRKELAEKLKDCVSKNQKEYVLREQMKVIRKELGEDGAQQEGERYRKQLQNLQLSDEVREKLLKEIRRFEGLSYASSESAVLRNYIETVLEFPWGKESEDNHELKKAMEQLENDHYGLEKIKERIIDYLAVRILSGRKDAPIICLVGPPGTGKTSIAKSVATALHKQYGRIALGGVRDEAEIRGHRKTYIGAMPGRIVNTIARTGVMNPLILLDEIDKTGSDYKGDVSSALLEVLDGEQNVAFVDHYFEVPVNLSNVLFMATANDAADIPAPLRDRMEMIEVNSYTENEKFQIAKRYLLEKQLQKNGLTKRQFRMTDEAFYRLIRNYTKEAGVRNLEQELNHLMQKTARGIVTGEYKSITINEKRLSSMLGVERYDGTEHCLKDQVGVATGLAWTKVGGDTLNIEVNLLDGKGGLQLTGNLGDVMKESAQIALSYIRTLPDVKKLPAEFFEQHIIHVHVPEGATPKDGPSAGITMALAMYSTLMNRMISGTLAMTGEITLKGDVLPIGGLKEKLLAAKTAGMKKVLVPERNRKNVDELESEITEGMQIIFVSSMKEVLEQGIVKQKIMLKR